MRRFTIKLLHWEYWPQWLVYLPLSVYYIYLSLKARSFFFFSGANPGIETGGMFFESKWDVLKSLPAHLCPPTVFVDAVEDTGSILNKMAKVGITFPAIAKPDRGERGWCVQKLHDEAELDTYRKRTKITFLVQSFVDYPIELSIFYVRHPKSAGGKISSVTQKELLSITGDGRATIRELILKNSRAYLQKDTLFTQLAGELDRVLYDQEKYLLVPYGNHSRGAEFRDARLIVDSQLTTTFDNICRDIPGFYYGRFDLKVQSIQNLKEGKAVAILELNGAGAEPAHIYNPGYRLLDAQKDLFWHYRKMCEIAIYNRQQGVRFMTLKEYNELKKREKQYKKMVA